MSKQNHTNSFAMALIFAIVFGAFFVGVKLFVFWKTGEFLRRDIFEVVALVVAIFIGAFLQFFFQRPK